MKIKGFTLLEVMIAVVLISLVLGAIYSTFFLAEKAIDIYKNKGIRLLEERMLLTILAKELRSMLYNCNDENTVMILKDRSLYARDASEIEFFTLEGHYKVRYYVKDYNGKADIYKKIIPTIGEEMEILACENIEFFLIKVYDGKQWLKLYNSKIKGKLPKKIEISIGIKMDNGDISIFKDIVSPKIEVTKW